MAPAAVEALLAVAEYDSPGTPESVNPVSVMLPLPVPFGKPVEVVVPPPPVVLVVLLLLLPPPQPASIPDPANNATAMCHVLMRMILS